MSAYSTEELVNALKGTTICNDIFDAIIVKLRAADKLYGVSLGIRGILQLYKNNPDIDIGEAWLSDLEKAIAECESGSHD